MTHLGKSITVNSNLTGSLFESNMMRVKLTGSASIAFVGLYLGADLGRNRLIKEAKWAVNQASINQQDVKKTVIPIPSYEEQMYIAEEVARLSRAAFGQENAIDTALKQSAAQRKNILKAAFAGELVPQDPSDEPASALLARIAAQRAVNSSVKRVKHSRKGTAS